MEYYSATKRNKLLIDAKWININYTEQKNKLNQGSGRYIQQNPQQTLLKEIKDCTN